MGPRHLLTVVVTVLALVASGAAVGAQASAGDQRGEEPRRIGLPRGWQPEGIAADGRSLFVGSLAHGGLWSVDAATGRGRTLAAGVEGRVAVGVEYDRRRNVLWVAGGDTGEVRAHDRASGRVLRTYRFGGERFLNDLTVTERGVYVTDSFSGELAVVPFPRRGDRLPAPRRARTLALTGDFQPVPDQFNLNGIVHHRGRLLAVQSVTGGLFGIDPATGVTRQVRVVGARLRNGDGMERRGDTLYVVRNRDNRVVALDLDRRANTATRVGVLRHRSLDVPTTAAVARGWLWAVNARFGTEPTPDTRYWITPLPLVR